MHTLIKSIVGSHRAKTTRTSSFVDDEWLQFLGAKSVLTEYELATIFILEDPDHPTK